MITIDINPNAFVIGSFILSWHGFFTFVGVVMAVILSGRWASITVADAKSKTTIDPEIIYSTATWGILGGIIGARVVHVIDNWALIYASQPIQVLYIWNGGIGLWGGILGGFIGGAIYALVNKHPVGPLADIAAPAMILVQTIGRKGDIVNGEHCARATEMFLGFTWIHPETMARYCADGYYTSVQPVILYEIVWNMVALSIIWTLRGRLKPAGMLFALYLALYAVGRFIISFQRIDLEWAYGMQEAHFISLLVLAITIPLLIIKARLIERIKPISQELQTGKGTRAERRRK